MKRIVVLLTLCTITLLTAGYYEPPFEEYLNAMPADADVRAVVIMADQVDVGTLDAELTARNADRQERHYVVCSALMNKCDQSQKNILAYLNQEKAAGNIRRIRSFWLSNSIALECKKSVLDQVVARRDVDIIYRDLPVELIKPAHVGPAPDHSKAYEWGLAMIRADSLWRRGVTGLGRLGFLLDVGVYLRHNCLQSRWRGRNGGLLQHAWKDAIGGSPTPTDPMGRGTHMCGTMVGGTPGDTVGAAFGGQWIADNAIYQGTGPAFDSDIREAYTWAADPDSNPGTVYDVPDAGCNGWGVDSFFSGYRDCDRRWNAELFRLEIASCLSVFGVGGTGPTSQSIRSPANICTTATLNYGVGSVDNAENIASFSARGPTDCTMYDTAYRIKPEVVAPGVNIRSSLQNGGYGTMSGTSMSTPHVAAAFMLLRQYNTNATPDTIKKLLMYTARDRGAAGEDNTYGWGIIDCWRALQAMPRSPSLAYLSHAIIDNWGNGNSNGRADPGERVQMVDTIWSAGGRRATGITGILRVRPGFDYVIIEDSTATFGDLDSLEGPNRKGHNNADRFQFRVLSTIPDNDSVLPFVLALRSNSGTYRVENIYGHWRGYSPVRIAEDSREGIPAQFTLRVRSPARNLIQVSYGLPHRGWISLKLYDAGGRLVEKLHWGLTEPGMKELVVDASRLPNGVYFVDYSSDNRNIVRKMTVLR